MEVYAVYIDDEMFELFYSIEDAEDCMEDLLFEGHCPRLEIYQE